MNSPSKKRNIDQVVPEKEEFSPNKKRKQENPKKNTFQSFKMKKSSVATKQEENSVELLQLISLSTGPTGSGSSQINPLKEMEESRIQKTQTQKADMTQQRIEKSFTLLKADSAIPDDWSIKKSVDIQVTTKNDLDVKDLTSLATQSYYLYESTLLQNRS